ncbi:hypothetical protein HDE_00258 [Halotydeus destructor]|nr:hypothetical protein HDE_00258 [Halotydeus destructor]
MPSLHNFLLIGISFTASLLITGSEASVQSALSTDLPSTRSSIPFPTALPTRPPRAAAGQDDADAKWNRFTVTTVSLIALITLAVVIVAYVRRSRAKSKQINVN